MSATQSKADMVRDRLVEIAYYRLDGQTWPNIATFLSVMGLSVTGDEIRSYWGRFAAGKQPAEFLVEQASARAEDGERRLKVAEKRIQELEASLAAWSAIGARIASAHRAQSNEGVKAEIEAISAWYDRTQPR